jgi:hypothetical protein
MLLPDRQRRQGLRAERRGITSVAILWVQSDWGHPYDSRKSMVLVTILALCTSPPSPLSNNQNSALGTLFTYKQKQFVFGSWSLHKLHHCTAIQPKWGKKLSFQFLYNYALVLQPCSIKKCTVYLIILRLNIVKKTPAFVVIAICSTPCMII